MMICRQSVAAMSLLSFLFLSNFLLVCPAELSPSARTRQHSKRATKVLKEEDKKDKKDADKKQQAGTYKTKEEIEKPPKMDHPCNLTRTTVKISFPELKGEVFVNLLGYKEPNLIPLWRCKGVCGDVESPIACSPTKMKQKKVMMTVKTHLHGRDSKESLKELILDEHEECGCQCNDLSISRCAGTFNERTCECECEDAIFGAEKAMCVTRSTTYWDSKTCQCRSKNVAPRETDSFMSNCLEDFPMMAHSSGFDVIGYIFLGSCITMAVILTATTLYYRGKLRKLSMSQAKNYASNNSSSNSNSSDSNTKDKKRKKSRAGWKHPSNLRHSLSGGDKVRAESSTSRSYESSGSGSGHHHGHGHHRLTHSQSQPDAVPILYSNSIPQYEEEPREEYDQHGVLIEKQVVIDF